MKKGNLHIFSEPQRLFDCLKRLKIYNNSKEEEKVSSFILFL